MMKIFFMMVFLIPLCFKNLYWIFSMILFFTIILCLNISFCKLFYFNLSYMMGWDMISYGFIILSIWICCLMYISSESLYKNNLYLSFFMFIILLLLIMLLLTFSSMNLFFFYLFFEASLIPTLMLIVGWGYQPERIQAGVYLLFYTLILSMPLLMSIFFLFNKLSSLLIYMYKFYMMNYFFLYLSMMMSFLVKMPMYFVHMWLPKAHVEAPVSGSMILAGVMLKLGGYGLMRIMIILQEISISFNFIWISISLVGGLLISLKCFCQIDMKSLIAYSSIAHMSMVIGGIMTMNYWGFMGSYILMIGHGLCSSGMFFLSNIQYERLNSRSLFLNKGMMNFMPSMSLWWFLLMSSNMAAPPSLNLMGEISLIISLMSWSKLTMLFLMMISFLSAGYSLYLFSYSQCGEFNMSIYSFYVGNSREYFVLWMHWFPLNFLVLKFDLFYLI